jgi:hypothetical protein
MSHLDIRLEIFGEGSNRNFEADETEYGDLGTCIASHPGFTSDIKLYLFSVCYNGLYFSTMKGHRRRVSIKRNSMYLFGLLQP